MGISLIIRMIIHHQMLLSWPLPPYYYASFGSEIQYYQQRTSVNNPHHQHESMHIGSYLFIIYLRLSIQRSSSAKEFEEENGNNESKRDYEWTISIAGTIGRKVRGDFTNLYKKNTVIVLQQHHRLTVPVVQCRRAANSVRTRNTIPCDVLRTTLRLRARKGSWNWTCGYSHYPDHWGP